MDGPAFQQNSADTGITSRTNRMEPQGFFMLGRQRKSCLDFVSIAARSPNICSVGVAEPRRRFDQRVEHRLQVERGAADSLKHVGGGSLLLQRFAQFGEQSRVLDGDDGLRGEVLNQIDLLVVKGTSLLAVQT